MNFIEMKSVKILFFVNEIIIFKLILHFVSFGLNFIKFNVIELVKILFKATEHFFILF